MTDEEGGNYTIGAADAITKGVPPTWTVSVIISNKETGSTFVCSNEDPLTLMEYITRWAKKMLAMKS